MNVRATILLTALASALAACGSKDSLEKALGEISSPAKSPALTAQGKNNGTKFETLSAGISRHPYFPGMYQVVLYNEEHGSACYGIGDTFVTIPVSQTDAIGHHSLRPDDLTATAVFTHGSQESRENTGYIEITELGAKEGHAKLEIGREEGNNYLTGEITLENCVK